MIMTSLQVQSVKDYFNSAATGGEPLSVTVCAQIEALMWYIPHECKCSLQCSLNESDFQPLRTQLQIQIDID
jgi:hypothetical protein